MPLSPSWTMARLLLGGAALPPASFAGRAVRSARTLHLPVVLDPDRPAGPPALIAGGRTGRIERIEAETVLLWIEATEAGAPAMRLRCPAERFAEAFEIAAR